MSAPGARRLAGRRRERSPERAREKEATRLKLLEAAARIIGRYGYAGCTIARVTARAKIAHGTFYLHFASQQAMFDELLPTLGARMLEAIRLATQGSTGIIDMERRGFEANFAYLVKHPYMYRVLAEAQLYAPRAYQEHHDAIARSYVRALRRGLGSEACTDEELERIAAMLVGARTQLLMRHGVRNNAVVALPDGTLDTYLKFVAHGLLGWRRQAAPARPCPANEPEQAGMVADG